MQLRSQFHVGYAGSNGYVAPTPINPTTTAIPSGSSRTTSSITPIPSDTNTPQVPNPSVCVAGVGAGNYAGLCSFCCNYGYCPPGPCSCSEYGTQVSPPAASWPVGYPVDGLDDSFLGLCSFACNHGYCPPAACTTRLTGASVHVPRSTPTSSVCVAGVGEGNYAGLCSFACNFGYCPPGPCSCTEYGNQVPPPTATWPVGYPAPGLDDSYLGLCSYSCNHGYCPPEACTTNSPGAGL